MTEPLLDGRCAAAVPEPPVPARTWLRIGTGYNLGRRGGKLSGQFGLGEMYHESIDVSGKYTSWRVGAGLRYSFWR